MKPRKRIQQYRASLPRSRNKRIIVGSKDWPVSRTAQQLPTTCNRVCKRTQHVTSNHVVNCWPTMLRLIAPGLKRRSSTLLLCSNHVKEMYKKCTFKSSCWPIVDLLRIEITNFLMDSVLFFSLSRCRRLLVLHDFIFCLSKLYTTYLLTASEVIAGKS